MRNKFIDLFTRNIVKYNCNTCRNSFCIFESRKSGTTTIRIDERQLMSDKCDKVNTLIKNKQMRDFF